MPPWLAALIRNIVHRWTRYVLRWLAAVGLTALAALIRIIVHRWTRYVLCSLAALGLTALHLHLAWHMYDTVRTDNPVADRRDANWGHTLVDYGGQWLTARTVAVGRGRELYSKSAQREVLEAGYPREDE